MTVGEQEHIFINAFIQALPDGVLLSMYHCGPEKVGGFKREYHLIHHGRHLEITFANDPHCVANTAIRGKEALDQMKKWLANSP
jgi:hypothetical protein